MTHLSLLILQKSRLITLFVLLGLSTSVWAAAPSTPLQRDGVPSFAPMIEEVRGAVVNIATQAPSDLDTPLSSDPAWQRYLPASALSEKDEEAFQNAGSGVVIDSDDGLILTHYRVVQEAKRIRVTLLDGRSFEAKWVGADAESNLALIQINADRLVSLRVGNSDDLAVGDFAVAIGNPFGTGQTLQSGMISGLGRSALMIPHAESLIQTDLSINAGNYGGAFFNLKGELVGINSALSSSIEASMGIGLVTPINVALRVTDQLLKYGQIRGGKVGVSIQDLNEELAKEFDVEPFSGVVVAQVLPDSSAEKAGMEAGDIIVEANGRRVKMCQELVALIGREPIGEQVSIKVQRSGEARIFRLEIQEPDPPVDSLAPTSESLRLRGAMVRNRIDLPIPNPPTQLVVERVIPDSDAAEIGLFPGDLILSVNRKKVSSVREVREMALEEHGRLLLLVQRDGRAFWLIIP